MTWRGVRKDEARMVTVEAAGIYRSDRAARAEILELLRGGPGAPR